MRSPFGRAPKTAAPSSGAENGNPQAPLNPLLPLAGLSFVFTSKDGHECLRQRFYHQAFDRQLAVEGPARYTWRS